MYHHMLRSSGMFDSIRRGCIMSHSIPNVLLLGGYRLPIATPPPFQHRNSSTTAAAVCPKRWSSSSSSFSSFPGDTTIPCLFLSPVSHGKILPVFNPSDRRFYDLPIPKGVLGRSNYVLGSGHGWLVMIKTTGEDYTMIPFLYNPFTSTYIPLPSLPSGGFINDFRVWCDPIKASPGQPLVSCLCGGVNHMDIRIYHQGDDDWSLIEIVKSPQGVTIASSVVYHEAEATLYVVYDDGRLSVLDLATRTLRPLIDTPCPEFDPQRTFLRLGLDAGGDLLLIEGDWDERPQYDVFKLDKRCLKWVRTTNIGNTTLFIYDDHQVVSTVCDPGFIDAKPNQIYLFSEGRARGVLEEKSRIATPVDVGVLDLIAAAASNSDDQKEQLFFKTSNILKTYKYNGYLPSGAWMVPPSYE